MAGIGAAIGGAIICGPQHPIGAQAGAQAGIGGGGGGPQHPCGAHDGAHPAIGAAIIGAGAAIICGPQHPCGAQAGRHAAIAGGGVQQLVCWH